MSREITTAEELDALPNRALIHNVHGDAFESDGYGNFERIGSTYPYESDEISLPATVLWEPRP